MVSWVRPKKDQNKVFALPGTPIEKQIYKGMSALDLVTRLLTKKCASYYGQKENYLLISGERGQGDFSKVGTKDERYPLTMENCLTRDEIKLSGFLLISSKVTKVIKDRSYGSVAIGIPFPCLNREGLFDHEDLVINRRQNTKENGYGLESRHPITDPDILAKRRHKKVWSNHYQETAIEFSTMNRKSRIAKREEMRRFLKLSNGNFIDLSKVISRLSVIVIGILAEANKRAKDEDKMAYVVIDKNSE